MLYRTLPCVLIATSIIIFSCTSHRSLSSSLYDFSFSSFLILNSRSKNLHTRGEPDSSTLVIEKSENVATLRKRRSFISFEEQEEDEEHEVEEASGGGKKGKKKKAKKSGGTLEEGSRCSRVNGRGWRCCQQTLVGYSLCEHHLGKGRVRSMNKSRGGEKKAAADVEVIKKKRVKLGMVKARSISSLLGQTSTSNVGVADATTESEVSAPDDQFAPYYE